MAAWCTGYDDVVFVGNPINKIDLLRLDSYIFYNPHLFDGESAKNIGLGYAQRYAAELKVFYGRTHVVHLVEMSTRENFEKDWNGH